MRHAVIVMLLVVLLVCGTSPAADWPQWRGPERSGVLTHSPALIDSLPDGGPKKLWQAGLIENTRHNSGWGSPAVADGRVYAFADESYDVPKDERILEKGHLAAHGYMADMPAELSAAVEAARVSEERKKLDNRTLNPWVDAWLKEHVTKEMQKFRGAAQARLRAGEQALPLDVLAKLAAIADKPFENDAAFEAWFKENGIDEAAFKETTKWVKKTNPASNDFLACLDAATGELAWRVEAPSNKGATHNGSSTPAVADGRVYAVTASCAVICHDAKTGAKVWEVTPFARKSPVHSSVLVADGVVAASAYGTVGLDAATGETLWEDKNLRADNPSPSLWRVGDRAYVLVNARELVCLELKTGKAAWKTPGGGFGSPVVSGDLMACVVRQKLTAWRMAADKAEKLWEMDFKDDYASPVILGEHVYAVGAAPRGKKEGRALCAELATGKVLWDAVLMGGPSCASPVIADGKIVALTGGEVALMKASPEAFGELARFKVGGDGYASPTLADGKLYLRVGSNIVCYDLAK